MLAIQNGHGNSLWDRKTIYHFQLLGSTHMPGCLLGLQAA